MAVFHTRYRLIYADTDRMGVAYHANYLRWFEIGRTEMFRELGMSYAEIESRGIFLPASEAYCKYLAPASYDQVIRIETRLDPSVRAGMKFDYAIFRDSDHTPLARGYTKHAFVNATGRVVRPPDFLKAIIKQAQAD